MNWLIVSVVNFLLRVCRLPGLNSSHVYALLGLSGVQPVLERMGRRRAWDVYRLAKRTCPAYAEFVAGKPEPRRFEEVPETTKENYVKKFSIEARCVGGAIPARGVVIDESSGSSGSPNNWVRGKDERESVKRLIQHGFTLTYRGNPVFLLNCFALGPWATGMNVSMSLADSVVLKSIGPDRAKLESTLALFGPKYRYVMAGYPPFVKDFIDTTRVDLSGYSMHLLVGGEGISEGLRDYFLRVFKTVHSSYGASDLEINIGAETAVSIALRRAASGNAALCRELFGRDEPPMVFQYNPLDYFVERSKEGELIFTLLRRRNVSPKVRYNIRDIGGTHSMRSVHEVLRRHGVDPASIGRGLSFPVLYVYGRSDLTVSFYGAKVYTTDFDAVLTGNAALRAEFNSFQVRVSADAALNKTLVIALERRSRPAGGGADAGGLSAVFYEGLKKVNQDFREVSKMFGAEHVRVEVFEAGQGPFAGRDIRVKHQYIG